MNLISSAIEQFESDSAIYESSSDRVATLKQMLQGQADRLAQDYPTAQVSDLMGRALAEQLPGIIESKDELNLTLADLKALTTQEIMVNGENIWDVTNAQGQVTAAAAE